MDGRRPVTGASGPTGAASGGASTGRGGPAGSELSVLAAAREVPDRPALIAGGRVLSYRELAVRVLASAEGLRSELATAGATTAAAEPASTAGEPVRGTAGGPAALPVRPVAVVCRRTPEAVCSLLALFELGVPVGLVHDRLTEPERAELLGLLRPVLTLDAGSEPEAGTVRETRGSASEGQPPGGHHPDGLSDSAIDPESILAVVPTSGSRGRPKAALLSRRAFLASARASAANLGWMEDDRWLLALPLAHVGGLSVLVRSLIARRCVVLAPPGPFDPSASVRTIDEHRVTLVSLVPAMLEAMLAVQPEWTPSPALRAILLGGAAAHATLLARAAALDLPVLTTYGLTEACSQVTTQRRGSVNRGDLGAGSPLEGVELRIMEGEIQLRGPMLFSGYLDAGEVQPGLDADGWLSTGDEGQLDEAGRLHVRGRLDRVIITGGENVDPVEVEVALASLTGIREAVVFGMDDPKWGRIVAAALVVEGPQKEVAGGLRRDLDRILAPHKRPRLVAFLGALPVTAAGKVDRAAAEETARERLRPL